MSGRAYAFAALSVLALAFGAFAGAGMLGAAEENYPLTGEVLVGERAYAARVEVRGRTTLADHLGWDVAYSPARGEASAEGGWSLPLLSTPDYGYASLPAVGVHSWFEDPFSLSWAADDIPEGVARGIYDALMAETGAQEGASGVYDLSDFGSGAPLDLDAVNFAGGEDALDGLFRIPLEDGWLVKATCSNGEFSLLPDSSLFDAVRMFSDSVFTPDGYIYFSIAAFAVEGEDTLRELSGAMTPGGEWGVWRVKCTLAPGTDTSENRWWTKDGVYVTPDVSTLESVSGDYGTLGLSGDGKYVLLATEASGSLRLEVFDAASGERVQSLETGVEPSMLSFHSGEGWVVLDCGGEVMALTQTDAGFETVLRCATDDSRLYALTRAMYYEDSGDYVYDGERIWRLEQALFDSERQYEYRRAYLLVGYGGEGMDYVELLTDAVTARHSDESLLWFGGDYGLDITEVGA